MSKVNFNVNAYTARLIGRENVSKLSGAVLELVKNSYDADASFCALYYEQSTDTLYLVDNGCGMTEDIINRHWMTIGFSSKKNVFLSQNGRVQTGAKGIGRFALDRISDKCEMLTINKENKMLWKVDWRDFTEQKNITDVSADLEYLNINAIDFIKNIKNQDVVSLIQQKFITGTIFKMTALREVWDDTTISSIIKMLSSLIPVEYKSIFDIYFFKEDTSILDADIIKDNNAFEYDYKIEFQTIGNDKIKVVILRNEFDFGNLFDEILKEKGFDENDKKYFKGIPIDKTYEAKDLFPGKLDVFKRVGDFSGVFYFTKAQISIKDKEKYFYKNVGESSFSENMSGIKLYRDHFRIRPYGEYNTSSYDWLQLSQRRNASPAAISHKTGKWRVSANQLMGSVFISRLNLNLPDQANREGIIETPEFGMFRAILISIISLFEEDRQKVGRILYDRFERINEINKIEDEIRKKAEEEKKNKNKKEIKYDNATEANHFSASDVAKVIDSKQNIIESLEDENRLLRALATTGIVTNTYIHEFKELTHKMKLKIVEAEDSLSIDKDIDSALDSLREVNKIKDTMNSWFEVTIETVKKDKRKRKTVNLQDLIENLKISWGDLLKPLNITLFTNVDKKIKFKCFPYEIEAIFSNLITNSRASFDNSQSIDKKIEITATEDEEYIAINYSDNGQGLSDYFKSNPYKILEPFETDKVDDTGEKIGTGMGMWIINKTVLEYNGIIDLSQNISDTGFHIQIKFKKFKGN